MAVFCSMRWIKIHKKLLEWEWADSPNMMALWIRLLLEANDEDKCWRGIEVKRGQFVTSLGELSIKTGISIRGIRTCLSRFKETGEIEEQTTNKHRIITICKYADYQLTENTSDKQTTNKRQANDKQNDKQTTSKTSNQNICFTSGCSIDNNIKRQANDKQNALKTTTAEERESIRALSKEKENLKEKESFVQPEFKEAFAMWLEYKKQRRESYKSELSLKKCYNNLVKLSGGNPTVAMAVVEQSMANNWAGLFALKQDYNGTNRKIDERAERAKGYAAVIAQLAKEDAERASGVRGQGNVPW